MKSCTLSSGTIRLIPFGMSGLKSIGANCIGSVLDGLIPFGMSGLKCRGNSNLCDNTMSHPVWDEWIEIMFWRKRNDG